MRQDFNHLKVAGLACARGEKTIFAELDFTARAAEVIHLQGRNGSGKTSLLRILCGFARPTTGLVTWNGHDIQQHQDSFFPNVGYIGHRRGVCEDLTPLENVQFAGALTVPKPERECRDALARVELTHVAETPARLLSAGQNQRIALARLLISSTPLWCLDEPFTALDRDGRTIIEAIIAEHAAAGGISIIATHQSMSLDTVSVQSLSLDPV